jgi:hypothetical protein
MEFDHFCSELTLLYLKQASGHHGHLTSVWPKSRTHVIANAVTENCRLIAEGNTTKWTDKHAHEYFRKKFNFRLCGFV